MTRIIWHFTSGDLLRLFLSAMVFLFFACQIDSTLAQGAPSPTMEITVHYGLISAELVNVPLIDVLQRVQEEFGFKAHYHGDLTERITMSFTSMPLQKCLRQLTVNQSLSVATRPTHKKSERNEAKQIAEIWVLSRSTTPQTVGTAPAQMVMPVPDSSDESVGAGEDSFGREDSFGQVINAQGENVPTEQSLNLQKTEESNKRETLTNLAETSDPASIMALAEFSHDVDRDIRQLSVSAIGSVDSMESTRVLGQVLKDESDVEIRKTALRALGQRQHEATAKSLLEEALNDTDVGVKTLAQQLLAKPVVP